MKRAFAQMAEDDAAGLVQPYDVSGEECAFPIHNTGKDAELLEGTNAIVDILAKDFQSSGDSDAAVTRILTDFTQRTKNNAHEAVRIALLGKVKSGIYSSAEGDSTS